MAESFGVKMGVEGEKEFKNALKEINSAFKVLGSEMNLVTSQFDKNDKSIQSLSARNGVLTKEIEAQKNKVQTLQAALENASSSFGEADSRTRSWQIQLNNAQADLNKMESELKANEDAIDRLGQEMEEAEEQTEDFAESLSDSGDMAEDSSGKFEKVGSVVAGVGTAIAAAAAAIGAAVVAASVELVKLGDEYNKAVNQISASTGATGTELEELGAIAQKVYTNNFGDSLEDVAEGLSIVQKTTGLVGDELQKATESGFALRDTFGYDLQESARAANALMKNFGVTAEEAYNIIAVGAQNGADQNGDLLDPLNEYSAQYSALGLSADQFVTGLINGAEAGVFSIDKVGDAVKEFNLRAKDGSNTTIEAFQALGMNADEMTKRFAAGGESAEEAFFEVVNALNNMDDPIAKNTAAVNLFGTQFEDLQANVLPVLAGMKDGAAASYDALSQINEIKYADLDSALEGTKRSIEGVFLPTVSQMSAGITDVFSTLGNAINEANGDFSQISVAIGTAIGDVAAIITEQMPMFLELGLNIVTSIGGAILENLPILIESATNIVLTILNSLIAALPQITEGALQLVLTLVNGILANLPQLVEAAIQMIVTLATGIGEALPQLIPTIVDAVILICTTLLNNMDKILDAAFSIITGLAQGLLNALPKLVAALPQIISSIINFITTNLPKIIEMGVKLVVQLAVGLVKAIPQLVASLPQIVTAIISGIGKAATSIVSVGKNIVTGLWSGVSSMISWVKNKISGFVGDIVGGIKSLLGIHSPSRVFAGIGDNMAKGLGDGFTDEMDKVSKDINNAIPTDFDVDARVGANTQTSGSGSGGTVITYTGPLVSVAQMVVRSEDDIRKVSQGLYNLMQSGTRAQGIIPIT